MAGKRSRNKLVALATRAGLETRALSSPVEAHVPAARLEKMSNRLENLIDSAENDGDAFAELTKALDTVPGLLAHAKEYVENQSRQALMMAVAGESDARLDLIERMMAAQRRELEGPQPSQVERLIADRIVHCLLHLQYVEARQERAQDGGKCTLAQLLFFEKWVDRAESRYLKAIRTLAFVRRLPPASLHVNVDARQVHVAGAAQDTPPTGEGSDRSPRSPRLTGRA